MLTRAHKFLIASVCTACLVMGIYWPSSVKAQGPTQGSIYWNPLQSTVSGCSWPPGITTSGITFAISFCPVGTTGQIYAAYNGSTNFALVSNGAQGPKGDKGDKGDTGASGAQGPAGVIPAKVCGTFAGGNGGQLVFTTAPCL